MPRRVGPPPSRRRRLNGKIRASCCMPAIRRLSKPALIISVAVTSPGPLDPENIKAYEVGGKHDLPFLNQAPGLGRFFYDYSNIQVSIQEPGIGGEAASQNAASSINRGVDLDLAMPIVRNLTASIGMEYLDARYESFPDAQVPNIVDGELGTTTPIGYEKSVDASGNRMERAPLLTSTAQLRWLLPIGTGQIETTASYYHNSGFYFDPGRDPAKGLQSGESLCQVRAARSSLELGCVGRQRIQCHGARGCSCIALRHGRVLQ